VSSQRFLEVYMKRQSQKILSSPSLQLDKSSRPVFFNQYGQTLLLIVLQCETYSIKPKKIFLKKVVAVHGRTLTAKASQWKQIYDP
jgi:hypothetical protein